MNIREKELIKMRKKRLKQIEKREDLIKEGKELFDYLSNIDEQSEQRISAYWSAQYYDMYVRYFDLIKEEIDTIDEMISDSKSDEEFLDRLKIFDGDLNWRFKNADKYLKITIRDLKELKDYIEGGRDDYK